MWLFDVQWTLLKTLNVSLENAWCQFAFFHIFMFDLCLKVCFTIFFMEVLCFCLCCVIIYFKWNLFSKISEIMGNTYRFAWSVFSNNQNFSYNIYNTKEWNTRNSKHSVTVIKTKLFILDYGPCIRKNTFITPKLVY